MLINIATVAVCLILTIALRRFDRSNSKILKLRRFTDRTFTDFKKLADDENRRFNDSTIEMDLLLKKAGNLTTGIRGSIEELEKKLSNLNAEKSSLKNVEENLQIVSNAAIDVNKQIKYIESAKGGFGDLIKKIHSLNDSVNKLEKENSDLISGFNEQIKQKSREITEEIASHMNRVSGNVAKYEEQVIAQSQDRADLISRNFAETISSMEHSVTATGEAILENVRSRVDSITRNVGALESRVESAEKRLITELSGKVTSLESRISSFSDMLKQEKDEIFHDAREDVKFLNEQIVSLKDTLANMEGTVFAEIRRSADSLKSDISQAASTFRDTRNGLLSEAEAELQRLFDSIDDIKDNIDKSRTELFDKADREAEKMMTKLKSLESTINSSKENMIADFDSQLARLREGMSDLSLHSIAKKDEIIKAVRAEAEEIRHVIEGFNDKYSDFEKKVGIITSDKIATIAGETERAELTFNKLEQRLRDIKNEIVSYEQSNRIFDRTDELRGDVENAVGKFQNALDTCQKGTDEIRDFLTDIEEFKEVRRNLEKELKLYQAKKDNMESITHEIHAVIDLAEEVKSKADSLRENSSRIEVINTKIDALQSSYSNLDSRIMQLNEHEDLISRSLVSMEKMELIAQTIDTRLNDYKSTVDKTEKKITKMREQLASVEQETLILRAKEKEIKDVRDKFMELESLEEHLEKRMTSVMTMMQRIEKMNDEIGRTEGKLNEMYSMTDNKMRQFADFIQSMGSAGPISKNIKKEMTVDKNINDSVIRTVRELNHKGWQADEISNKLMIDENTVRLIINTASM